MAMSARSDSNTPLQSTKPRKQSQILLAATLLAFAATLFCLLALPQTDWYRERRYAHMALSGLIRERARHRIDDDPILLYYLGSQYNHQGQFAKADPVLRQAVGLDPESPRLRDAWTRALLGSGLTTAAFGQLREYAGTHPNSAPAHLILGKFYVTQKSMKRASEELERAVALDPQLAEAWTYLTIAQEELDNLGRAAEAGEKAVALQPKDAGNRLRLADLQMRLSRTEAARQNYEQALTLDSHSGKPEREYARALLRGISDANAGQIVAMAQRAAMRRPNDTDAQLVLGRALLQNAQAESALAPLQRAVALAPNNPAPLLVMVQALRKLGRLEEAQAWQQTYENKQRRIATIRGLASEVMRHPDATGAHRRLAHLAAQQGDVATSVYHYAHALHRPLDSPPALVAAANDLTQAGFATQALPLARRAVGVGPHSPAAHEALGNVWLALGNSHEAAAEYTKAATWWSSRSAMYRERLERFNHTHPAATPPDAPAEQAYQASRRLVSGQVGPIRVPAEAVEKAREAVGLAPRNPLYLKHLLTLLFLQHRNAEALDIANKLIAVAPGDPKAHAFLGLLLVETSTNATALHQAEAHLLQAKAADSEALQQYGLGLLAMARMQPDQAIACLKRAIVLDPEPDVTYYKLARAYKMAGRDAEAAREMKRFRQRSAERDAEAEALRNVGHHADDPKAYARAAAIFEAHHRQAQAQTIRNAAPGR